MGGNRRRRAARDLKYTTGVDLAADGSVDTTVTGYWQDGRFTVVHVGGARRERELDALRAQLSDMSTRQVARLFQRVTEQMVIEGEFVEGEPNRPLDAGGSEP